MVAYGSYQELSENGVKLESFLDICGQKEQQKHEGIDTVGSIEDTSNEHFPGKIGETNIMNDIDQESNRKEDTSSFVNIAETKAEGNNIHHFEEYNDDTNEDNELVSTVVTYLLNNFLKRNQLN